jgi:hypothetical protein
MSDGGKGSAPRPFSVDMATFDLNFDRIFGKHEQHQSKTDTGDREHSQGSGDQVLHKLQPDETGVRG